MQRILFAVALFSASAAGAEVREPSISSGSATSLSSLIEEAVRVNPGVRAARERLSAAAERPRQAKSLPNPMVTVSEMTSHLETRGGPMEGKVMAAQAVPFLGKRALRGEAAERGEEVARQGLAAEELKVRAQVVRAYYDLYYLRRAREILGEQVDFLRHFARVAEKKYAVGRGPQSMVFRAQAELAGLQNETITVEQEAHSALARLNSLLDRKPWEKVGGLNPPPFPEATWDLERLRGLSLRSRPELLALAAMERKSEAERRLAFKRFFPDFQIGYEWTRIGGGTTAMPFDGRDAHAFSLGLSLPLWGRVNGAGYREARAGERAAELNLRDQRNRTLFELEDLSVRAETAARMAEVDEEAVLPQIRAAVKATLVGYEADSANFLDLLDAERELLKRELSHIRHKAMFHQLVAEMERVVGGRI